MASRWTKACAVIALALVSRAQGGDLSWSGLYRVEGVETHNLELGSAEQVKSYANHHLILRPTIVAADGFILRSRFDILNNAAYPDSQLGQFFGHGPRGPANVATNNTSSSRDSNVLASSEASDTIAINELYLTWTHEFGSLVVGRVPLQFGLGMTYSAGNGEFDHWFNNRDMIGYKMVFGNMFLLPMIGKLAKGQQNSATDAGNGGDLGHNGDVNDYMLQFQYDNAETGVNLGVFYSLRVAPQAGNDAPAGTNTNGELGGTSGVNRGDAGFKMTQWNIFFAREFSELKFAVETAFTNGTMGVKTSNANSASEVGISSFGIATEVGYKPQGSKYNFLLKMGIASGDQSDTDDRFEGFYFNRNYDVADLMFNHVLGLEDFLRTQLLRGEFLTSTTPSKALTGSQVADTETVSNAVYFSPSVTRRFGEQWTGDARLTYAMLHSGPLREHPTENDLGYELDVAASYKPFERFTWRTGASALFPGRAFVGGDMGHQNNFAWGMFTKAAIRF